MKRVRQTVALLLCAVIACIAVTASAFAPGGASADKQVPQRDTRKPVAPKANAAPAPEGTATLAGTVVADASGAPVRLAYVVLIGAGTGVLKVTSTDHTGTFSFTKLIPASTSSAAIRSPRARSGRTFRPSPAAR